MIRLFGTGLIPAPFRLSIFTFLVYFVATWIAAFREGTLGIDPLPKFWIVFGRHEFSTGRLFMQDVPHILSSAILIPVLFFLMLRIALGFRPALKEILASGSFRATEEEIELQLARGAEFAGNKSLLFLRVTCAVAVGSLFISLHFSDAYPDWWGSSNKGFAGIVLSVATAWVGYVLGWGILFSINAYLMLRRIIQHGAIHRPFDPDRCGGFKPLGTLILLLYCCVFILVACFAVVYYFGYFGLEKSILFNVSAAGVAIFAPLFLFLPIRTVTRKVQEDRFRILRCIGDKQLEIFHRIVDRLDWETEKNEVEAEVKLIKELKAAAELSETANIWPFNVRATRSLVLAYGAQVVAVAYQIIKHLSHG